MPIGSLQPRDRARPIGIVALVSVIVVLNVATPMAGAAPVTPRSAPAGQSTAYAVIGTLETSSQGGSIAISNNDDADISDDTVFIGVDSDVLVFSPGASTGSTGSALGISSPISDVAVSDSGLYVTLDSLNQLRRYPTSASGATVALASASLPESPTAVALGGAGTVTTDDDSAYVVYYNNRNVIDSYSHDLAGNASAAIVISDPQPRGVLVGGSRTSSVADDSLYVVGNGNGAGTLIQLPGDLSRQASLRPGYGLAGVAVHDDSLIIGPTTSVMRALKVNNWDDSVPMGANGGYIASSRLGLIGSVDSVSPTVSFVPVGSATADDTVALNLSVYYYFFSRDVAFAGDGVAYVTYTSTSVALIDKVTAATPATSTGAAGSTLNISLTLASGRLMDDSTVESVWFGDDTVAFTRLSGQNALSVTVPALSGTVSMTVALRGGNAMDAGSFTTTAPPGPNPPAPAVPASAPRDVSAIAGDASASVSWTAPASSGSYPVTNYLVMSAPSGQMCLTSTLTCDVTGLSNGTAYTFTVKALTGAGWSSPSAPSNAVTPLAAPKPTITISGSHQFGYYYRLISVTGTTTGLGMGAILNPWVRLGDGAWTQGATTIRVNADGTFYWSRRAGGQASVYVATPAGDVRSNVVRIL